MGLEMFGEQGREEKRRGSCKFGVNAPVVSEVSWIEVCIVKLK